MKIALSVLLASVFLQAQEVKVWQVTCPSMSGIPPAFLPLALPNSTVVTSAPVNAWSLQCFALDSASFIVDNTQNPPVLRVVVAAAAIKFVDDEVPAGAVDGTNKTFTLANVPAVGSLKVYWNGIRQKLGVDYSLTGKVLTFLTAAFPRDSKDLLTADYRL